MQCGGIPPPFLLLVAPRNLEMVCCRPVGVRLFSTAPGTFPFSISALIPTIESRNHYAEKLTVSFSEEVIERQGILNEKSRKKGTKLNCFENCEMVSHFRKCMKNGDLGRGI